MGKKVEIVKTSDNRVAFRKDLFKRLSLERVTPFIGVPYWALTVCLVGTGIAGEDAVLRVTYADDDKAKAEKAAKEIGAQL